MVSVARSTATPIGFLPTVTFGGRWPQPECRRALQVAALITETVRPPCCHVDGAGGLVDGDPGRAGADGDRGRGLPAAGVPMSVAGGAVDDRDRAGAAVGHVDRIGGPVDGDPGRTGTDADGGRGPRAAGPAAGVAGGGVEHRDRVAAAGEEAAAAVGDVDGAGRPVDRDRVRARADGGGGRLMAAAPAADGTAPGGPDHRDGAVGEVGGVDGAGGRVGEHRLRALADLGGGRAAAAAGPV